MGAIFQSLGRTVSAGVALVIILMLAAGSGSIVNVGSVAGLVGAPYGGLYAASKHAVEALTKSMRAELAPLGIDVTKVNPGPYNTGFNDRMADTMWEWFDDKAVNAPNRDMHLMMKDLVTTNQMDPQEVVQRMVELVEADTTTENNFVPPNIVEMLSAQVEG